MLPLRFQSFVLVLRRSAIAVPCTDLFYQDKIPAPTADSIVLTNASHINFLAFFVQMSVYWRTTMELSGRAIGRQRLANMGQVLINASALSEARFRRGG
jgi:hypothetical protein